jgi:anti-anti-sigma factor
MTMDLRIASYRPYDDIVIELAGELDLATTHKISDTLDAVNADRFARTTIDCADLSFCDCTGLDTLITTYRNIANAGGQLRLTRPRPGLRRIIDLTSCHWLLDEVALPRH